MSGNGDANCGVDGDSAGDASDADDDAAGEVIADGITRLPEKRCMSHESSACIQSDEYVIAARMPRISRSPTATPIAIASTKRSLFSFFDSRGMFPLWYHG